MDPRTPLDHVHFQLTPTRTRCDLVIHGGGVSEKLASGLLQPFLSHLKTAQQQISKGGYSISLAPPPNASCWFTKATLQRFVRFVSTPEVLERFVTIEKELEQIESSVQSNDIADAEGANGSLRRSSSGGDFIDEDNSKARLQRALETRKAVLRKEQAMAYARALVTGFELDSINDLVSFADAFGASRLREACLNFMELCKKKNQDRMWMDEIAAMQASRLELPFQGTSGIVLASEENYGNNGRINGSVDASESSHGSVDLNQDSGSAHASMTWSNHYPQGPQYMNNFQGPMYSQMPPYQGYMYPPPPYLPGNVQWPPKGDNWEPEDRKKHKSSSRKKKASHRKGHETPDSAEPSDSGSETQSDDNSHNSAMEKNHRKKSSRKVIIRNINYITSDKDREKEMLSDGEDKSTSRSHKKSHRSTVNESNDGNGEGTKGNEPWGAFQSILLQEKDSDAFESEQPSPAVNLETEGKGNQHAISSDSFIAVTRGSSTQEEFHHGRFEAGNNLRPSRIKTGSTLEESLLSRRDEGSENFHQATFTDHSAESLMIKSQKEGDWFISNRASDGYYDSSSRGDHSRFEESKKSLPVDDSFFIQNRSFVEDQSEPALRREVSMDADIVEATQSENGNKSKSNDKFEANTAHEPEDLYMVLGRDSATENANPSWTPDMDYENNNPLSTEPEPASTIKPEDAKKGPVRKSPGKEETKSKTSNGTLGRSKTEITSRNKKPIPAGKSSTPRNKNKEEETRKRLEELAIQRQKRIAERSAAASKRLPVKKTPTAKTEDPKTQPAGQQNKKTVFRSSTIERLATARVTPKVGSVQSKATQPKKPTPKADSASQKRANSKTAKPDATQKKESKATPKPMPEHNSIDECQDIKELHSIDSMEKKEVNNVPLMETKEETSSIHNDSPKEEIATESVREIKVRSENVTWAEKCEIIQIATPPQEEIIAEAVHTRKKWNTEETSPKAVRGFRKLLMFGRKSRSSAVSMA